MDKDMRGMKEYMHVKMQNELKQLYTGFTEEGIMLSARARAAALILKRIKTLPISGTRRAKLVAGKAYTMGLFYGVEAAPLNGKDFRCMQGKAADAVIGQHQSCTARKSR